MRGTFFFVHGTGVRRDAYESLWGTIQRKAKANGLGAVTFVGCPWGPERGANLDRIPMTLPIDLEARGAESDVSEGELVVALWALLLEDPLFELRIAAQAAAHGNELAPGEETVDRVAEANVSALADNPPAPGETGFTTADIARAARTVSGSRELRGAALAAGSATDPEFVDALARAIVAEALSFHRAMPTGVRPAAATSARIRDVFVAQLAAALAAPGTRGVVTDWLRDRIVAFAKQKGTEMLRASRDPLMRANISGAADILYFQRRGAEIVQYVTSALSQAQRPIVAVAHSLGGVVLADVLAQEAAPPIDLLVTVGSQPSFFYAIDALDQLRPGGTRKPFVPWLNFYDRNDLLSYTAERTFPGVADISDIEIDSRVPFPDAHGAYWHDDRVYQRIKASWPS
jgi:hypothetical protein